MKYSFLTFSAPRHTLDEILTLAKRLGYDGVEPRVESGHRHGVELASTAQVRRIIREQFTRSGIKLACLSTNCQFANPATHDGYILNAHHYLDLAGDIGAASMRVLGGAFPDSVSREQASDLVVKALRGLAYHAQDRGVMLCIETHGAWSDSHHLAEVMKRVNHRFVSITWDIAHCAIHGKMSPPQSYAILKPWIHHVHIRDLKEIDGRLRQVPLGSGCIDPLSAIRLLVRDGFAGCVSGEWLPGQMLADFEPDHLRQTLKTLKACEAQPD